ncbi:MAG: hypothetical protein EBZ47_08300, partial [Chlamydiae bacterium]|nr:hypothetical protein [Chlamydiota bacterium]
MRHFFLSYKIFFKSPGNIHLFIWKRDQVLLDKIEKLNNLILHYKDDVPELVEDDFRNQMYLKLIAHRYVTSEWFWVTDADCLICAPLSIADFFIDGKPIWIYSEWTEVIEKSWRAGSEAMLGSKISKTFMVEFVFIFNKIILEELSNAINLKNILYTTAPPSEFILCGAYIFKHHTDVYRWIHVDTHTPNYLCYLVNQRPPSYMLLESHCSLSDIGRTKYVLFWSHWDLTEQKMCEFLCAAQEKHLGAILYPPDSSPLWIPINLCLLQRQKAALWDGCYTDGWAKRTSSFFLPLNDPIVMKLEMETHLEEVSLKILHNGDERTVRLHKGSTPIFIPLGVGDNFVSFHFSNGEQEYITHGKYLYAQIKTIAMEECDPSFLEKNKSIELTLGMLKEKKHMALYQKISIEKDAELQSLYLKLVEKESIIQHQQVLMEKASIIDELRINLLKKEIEAKFRFELLKKESTIKMLENQINESSTLIQDEKNLIEKSFIEQILKMQISEKERAIQYQSDLISKESSIKSLHAQLEQKEAVIQEQSIVLNGIYTTKAQNSTSSS